MQKKNKLILVFSLFFTSFVLFPQVVSAAGITDGLGGLSDVLGNETGETSQVVQLFLLTTALSLAPTFLVLTTCFTRIIVVLSFVRSSLGTQQNPPNLVLMGIALFLSLFIMQPVYTEVMNEAITPYINEEISGQAAFESAALPIKEFMYKQTRDEDIQLFLDISETEKPADATELPLNVAIPAFIISELRTAFSIGFLIFIPFLVIDIVVASILMSMGMFMLSPVMISLPFKLLLFVLVDGWYLVIESLVTGFQ
ncbi:flagellar type III secretion system pore protein FliP [Carnobacterium sp. ISL-102]|uniref:flagellar type III secretion system pore protein FliP n=1 Tax=Carnobacterium sp. ISL-102 TaxID=2819142 RepID=UPI001BEA6DAD|nr:flagellar type III secretion system pore protein FliP [Carnobacterium sp. ISL-102]MBT2731875.1 flagellar type III secretion system pore protein FliP [Carnobacterium sp. ISL-102]